MKKLLKLVAAAGIMTAAFMQPAFAAMLTFQATLTSDAEFNPANHSTAFGTAFVTLDDVANTMHVIINYNGLTSDVIGAHIHCCLASPFASGNVSVATTTPAFLGFPTGAGTTSGSYDAILDMTLASSFNNPSFINAHGGTIASERAALFLGIENVETYLNIHTVNFGGGEIRGFLIPVPEPITLSLFGAGVAGAMALRRKAKKRA